ncbi:MAG: transposase [Sedimentisphaerales bacterium]|nr:transposase [Sedimentisphaerales bacterium]
MSGIHGQEKHDLTRETCFHVINRGNNRSKVFHKDQDYLRFTEMLGKAVKPQLMRLLSWCLMPNHFLMVL